MNETYVRKRNRTTAQIATDIGDLQEQIKALQEGKVLPAKGGDQQGGASGSSTSFFESSLEVTGAAPAIAIQQESNVNGLYRLVRDFAIKAKPWTNAIRYFTKPDEAFDLTLVSRRVYGTPDEFIVIMAAANLDSVENGLSSKELVLPPISVLSAMKNRAGYIN